MKSGVSMGDALGRLTILLAVALTCQPALAQLTTNDWQPTGAAAGGYWTNTANWLPGIPDSSTHVAQFATDYTANFSVTQNVSVTLNGLIYNDPAAGDTSVLAIRPIGSATLTFAGTAPFISNASDYAAQLQIYTPVNIGSEGLTIRTVGNTSLRSFFGSGTLTNAGGTVELSGDNTNFTGQIVVETGTTVDLRGGTANTLGTTNAGTVINGTGTLRLRDLNTVTISEPVTINGFNSLGSIRGYASTNVTFNGPVLLNTNGVLTVQQWFSPSGPGARRDWYVNSVISDDGNARGIHFLNGVGDAAGTGIFSRTSEIVVGGASTYGGYTHITANRAPDAAGLFTGTVRLTNGNDRLPTGTTVFLGGITNGVGHAQGNGRLVLNGYNQELAGLTAPGTGISNRVTGGHPTLSTLTLNIGAGVTNRFTGFLGGSEANDNNLALVSRGPGILDLAGANTYNGTTTITNGTLRANGTHIGGGNYTIQNGGTLGGTGFIDAAIQALAGGFVAPGNSIGTLTTSNSFDLDGTLQIELANGSVGLSDLLDVNGFFDITNGTVQFVYGGTLTNDFYVFAEYDTLSGPFGSITLPDGYGIDYQFGVGDNQIALFLIPEPSTLALLALGIALIGRLAATRVRETRK